MAKKNYWNDEHEKLIILYNIETDQIKRSQIYNQLRPALLKMYQAVLNRYSWNFIIGKSMEDQQTTLDECETYIAIHTIPKFNPDRAKAFSFIGTSTKHFYFDWFKRQNLLRKTEPLDFETDINYDEGVYVEFDTHQHYDCSQPEIDLADELLEIKTKAVDHVRNLMVVHEGEVQQLVLKSLLRLFEQKDYDKYYATYFLLKITGLKIMTLYSTLLRMGIKDLIINKKELEYYQQIISNYADEHGRHKNYVRFALNNLKDNPKSIERKYKVQERKVVAKMLR